MSRVYEGHYGVRFIDATEFAAFGAGGFRPNRNFRLAVTAAPLGSGQGLALQSAEGDVFYLPEAPLGQVQVAGEAVICQAILMNDGTTPTPNATALGTATIEIGYVKDDRDEGNAQAKG